MSHEPNAPFLVVIDTDSYAGNFERDLCAYITGTVGECGVGDDMAALFKEETGLEPLPTMWEPDEHGCHRPVTSYPTPGWFNAGCGRCYLDTPENEIVALREHREYVLKDRYNTLWHRYLKDWRENPASRPAYEKAGHTEEKLAQAAAEEERRGDKEAAKTKVSKYPAYLSVAISFEKPPTPEQLALMKERAHQFATQIMKPDYGTGFTTPRIGKILGFRLVEQEIKRTLRETSL